MTASGPAADHVVAFDRGGAITVATRFPVGLARDGGWGDTTLDLPDGTLARPADRHPHGRPARRPAGGAPRRPAGEGVLSMTARPVRRLGARARSGCGSASGGDEVLAMTRGDDGWWTPTEPLSVRDADYGYLLDDDPDPRPDPRSRRQPGGVHGLSRRDASTYDWGDDAWTGRQLAGAGDLRAPRRHVHAAGRPRRRDRPARPPPRPRRRLRRADAGQRVQRHPQLGLRRRRLVRGARAVRRPGRLPPPRRRLPRRRASGSCRTWCTTTSARRATTSPSSVPTSRTAATPGATWSTSTARARPRCAATSSTTCGCGSRTSTSTPCASTRCTRSATPPRCTSSRRWPSRRPPCRPTCAGR